VNYMIIYQKHNGNMIYRFNKRIPHYKKGDTTSMGWKVIDIQRLYKGKVISNTRYYNISDFKYQIRRFYDLLDKIDIYKLILLIMALYILIVKL